MVVDLTGVTTKQIILLPPDGSSADKILTADFVNSPGTDGKIKFVTIAGTIDEVGEWRIQAKLVLATAETFFSSVETFNVLGSLA